MSDRHSTTRALLAHTGGDLRAADQFVPALYTQMRAIAGRLMGSQRSLLTLQPTALVHEAYLRLIDVDAVGVRERTQFLALAARVLRNVLVDHVRARRADKRGGGRGALILEGDLVGEGQDGLDPLILDEALTRFAVRHPRPAQVVELRIFGGMSVEEVGSALNVSKRTIVGDWSLARAWLARELTRGEHAG